MAEDKTFNGSAPDMGAEMETTVLSPEMLGQMDQSEMETTLLSPEMLSGGMQGSGPLPGPQPNGPFQGPGPQPNGPFQGPGPQPNMPPIPPQPQYQGPGPQMNGPQGPGPQPIMQMQPGGPMPMQGSGPLPGPQMNGPQPGGPRPMPGQPVVPMDTPKKQSSGSGMKIFGIITLILAVLGLAAVIVVYILFGMAKNDYKSASSEKLKDPITITEITTDDSTDDTDEETNDQEDVEEEVSEEEE